jgi:hypothetical protein
VEGPAVRRLLREWVAHLIFVRVIFIFLGGRQAHVFSVEKHFHSLEVGVCFSTEDLWAFGPLKRMKMYEHGCGFVSGHDFSRAANAF